MAEVNITIRRDNGMSVNATGTVDDALVADMAGTLAAILFDASMTPVAAQEAPE